MDIPSGNIARWISDGWSTSKVFDSADLKPNKYYRFLGFRLLNEDRKIMFRALDTA